VPALIRLAPFSQGKVCAGNLNKLVRLLSLALLKQALAMVVAQLYRGA
jgi:hypothetical protein